MNWKHVSARRPMVNARARLRRRPKGTTVAIGLAVIAAMAVASPAIGGPSLKSLVKKEVSKQLAGKTGPQGPAGAPGATGPGVGAPTAFISAGLADSASSCTSPGDNGWADLAPNVNNEVSYQRDFNGTVHLRGVAEECGTPASNVIFTLPAGFRPARQEVQLVVTTGSPRRLDINSDGTVGVNDPPLGIGLQWVSLDGISFRCAPSGSNGCP